MRCNRGQGTLARVFIGEDDHFEGEPLYEVLLRRALDEGLAGGTVLRGVEGFGKSQSLHSSRVVRLREDLPIVIEIVDARERIEAFLRDVQRLLALSGCNGFVTLEPIEFVRYVA